MYYAHYFAHEETLRRACDWLERFGFQPESTRVETNGSAWLGLQVGSGEYAEVQLLVSAIERTDPQGWPSFWDEAQLAHATPPTPAVVREAAPGEPHHAAIGWHPIETTLAVDGFDIESLREALGR